MPGAYLKAVVQGTATLGVVIDGSANSGCPASSMPVIEYSVDQGPFKIVQLTKTGEPYTLPLATGLDPAKHHRLELYFRAADLEQKRWQTSTGHLRLNGLVLDPGGSVLSVPLRSKRALAYGDSITEGVGVNGLFTSWSIIDVNSARLTWFPLVCTALDCEYGQLGSGGWGMSNTKLEMPPLHQIWDRYDASTSRLVNGLLSPEPDYVFCALGTNDPGMDITGDYIRWLIALRKACGRASVFCVVPPLGWHKAEVRAAVSARNQAGDQRVYLIDLAPLETGFRVGQGATALAYDGVHPSVYGNALLGVLITAEAQKKLSN
jgi:lysophospholipase L1-like esterase